MSLPIVQSSRNVVALSSAEVDTLMQTASGSIEASEYFVSRYKEDLGRKASPLLIEKLEEWQKLVIAGLTPSENKWSGEYVERSTLANSLRNLSQEAISNSNIMEVENIHLDFAMNQEAQFVRGYSSNGTYLNDKTPEVKAMDLLFNTWLTENSTQMEDGILYRLDEKNKKTPFNPIELNSLIQGFKEYAKQQKNINLEIQQKEYPSPSAVSGV